MTGALSALYGRRRELLTARRLGRFSIRQLDELSIIEDQIDDIEHHQNMRHREVADKTTAELIGIGRILEEMMAERNV